MGLQTLPSEIILQIFKENLPDLKSLQAAQKSYGNISIHAMTFGPLRLTCKRFNELLSGNATYLKSLLVQGQSRYSNSASASSSPQLLPISNSDEEILDLLTQLSRHHVCESLIRRLNHALKLERKQRPGICRHTSAHAQAVRCLTQAVGSIHLMFAISCIVQLRQYPPSLSKSTRAQPVGRKIDLIQRQMRSIPEVSTFDNLIAVLFALATLLIDARQNWLWAVSKSTKTTSGRGIGDQRSIISSIAKKQIEHEFPAAEMHAPSYAHAPTPKYAYANEILRKGPRWAAELLKIFDDQRHDLHRIGGLMTDECLQKSCDTCSASNRPSYDKPKPLGCRIRLLLCPLSEITMEHLKPPSQLKAATKTSTETSAAFSRVDSAPDQSQRSIRDTDIDPDILPLLWMERERRLLE